MGRAPALLDPTGMAWQDRTWFGDDALRLLDDVGAAAAIDAAAARLHEWIGDVRFIARLPKQLERELRT